jgi:hypothetical protein
MSLIGLVILIDDAATATFFHSDEFEDILTCAELNYPIPPGKELRIKRLEQKLTDPHVGHNI